MNKTSRLPFSIAVLCTLVSISAMTCHHSQAASKVNVPFITAAEFQKDVLQSKEPVLVDFSATWCAPCRAMAPFVDEMASKFSGKMKFYKIDIDDDEDLADDLNVESLPTFMFFKDGKIVNRETGNIGAASLDANITQVLNPSAIPPVKTVEKPTGTF